MGEAEGGMCPRVEAALAILSRKWVGMIVRVLLDGEQHFCELERALPALSARVLSVKLKELELDGLVERVVNPGPPTRVSYRLTAKGLALRGVMSALAEWAHSWETPTAP